MHAKNLAKMATSEINQTILNIYTVPIATVSGLLKTKDPNKTKVIVFWQEVMPFGILDAIEGVIWRGNDGLARWTTSTKLVEGAFLHVANIDATSAPSLTAFTESDAFKIAQFLLEPSDFFDFIFACEDGRSRSAATAEAFIEILAKIRPKGIIKYCPFFFKPTQINGSIYF